MLQASPAGLAQEQHHASARLATAAPTIEATAAMRLPLTGDLAQLGVVTETI